MATHQLAKGLASLGRHGDSMLMHVTPREVAGLSHLAKSMGGEVTINPHTGLPEAGFFDFITNMLPTIAAIALAAPTGGTSLTALPETMAANVAATTAASAPGLFASMQAAPILGGMATGAAVAGAKGEDPLMGGLMGGISGVGAPSMANAFNNMAAPAAIPAAGGYVNPEVLAANSFTGATAPGAELANTQLQNASVFNPALRQGTNMAVNTSASGLSGLASNAGTNLANVGKGVGDFAMHPLDTYDKFTKAGGSGAQLALGVGLPALQAMQPEPYDPSSDEAKRKAEENKYRDPITGKLNLLQSSPGLRLATGGTVGSNQSSISTGGIQDLYGTSDQTTGSPVLSKDGYGIGRLENLASQGSNAKAADTFYAEGGPIAFASGGSSNIYIPGYNDPVTSQGSLGGNGLLALLAQMFAKQGMLNPQANTSTSSTPSTPMTIDPLNAPGMYPQAADNYMASNPTDKGTFALQAAKGGYLDGAGDGMSDSIPGTIEGKQPARLADGEFVVPADVVSHLGNGSSKAGAKNLYAMMNKVRKARTGNPKQGKQINPNKYMPA
jgi:hypothetical protein